MMYLSKFIMIMRVIHIYYIYNLPSSMYGVTKANM